MTFIPLPQSTHFNIHLRLYPFSSFTHQDQFVRANCLCGLLLGGDQLIRGYMLSENYPFPSQKLVIANSLLARVVCVPDHLSSCCDFSWACTGFVHTVETTVCLCVELPCWIENVMSPCGYIPALALTHFLLSLLQWSLHLGRRERGMHVPFRVEDSAVSQFCTFITGYLCVGHCILQVEASQVRAASICRTMISH